MNIQTISICGANHVLVDVESDVRRGLYKFDIIGLADKTIEESKLRILSAIRNSGISEGKRVSQKTVVLLSPAHVKKVGTHFDLAIAISYLQSLGTIKIIRSGWVLFGELGLHGNLKQCPIVQSLVMHAREFGFSKFIVPTQNLSDIEHLFDIEIFPASNLKEVVRFLSNKDDYLVHTNKSSGSNTTNTTKGLENKKFIIDSIQEQSVGKRALTIALAGKHHIIFKGPPGVGKSLFAKSAKELFEETCLQEFGSRQGHKFRSPHHTISYTQMIGNKNSIGEVQRAHNGILYLDELSEFNRRTLEALRQPLEEGCVESSQTENNSQDQNKINAHFTLIATTNLCKCGYFESTQKPCTCSALQVRQYQNRISGPILDRIDIEVYLQENSYKKIFSKKNTASVQAGYQILTDIHRVQKIQSHRVGATKIQRINKIPDIKLQNIELSEKIISELDSKTVSFFRKTMESLRVSKRAEYSIARVARTIADIECSDNIQQEHILEAANYRVRARP